MTRTSLETVNHDGKYMVLIMELWAEATVAY